MRSPIGKFQSGSIRSEGAMYKGPKGESGPRRCNRIGNAVKIMTIATGTIDDGPDKKSGKNAAAAASVR